MEYTVDYFIAKFTNTREDKWTVGRFFDSDGNACAYGWCGMGNDIPAVNDEAASLGHILNWMVPEINDGFHRDYQQPTPKQRILAALYDKKGKTEQPKEIIRYVSVPETITEQKEELILN